MTMLHRVGVRKAGNTLFLWWPRARTLCSPSTSSAMISQAFHSYMSVTQSKFHQRSKSDTSRAQIYVKTLKCSTLNNQKVYLSSRLACAESTWSSSASAFGFFSGCRSWSPGLTATGKRNGLESNKIKKNYCRGSHGIWPHCARPCCGCLLTCHYY